LNGNCTSRAYAFAFVEHNVPEDQDEIVFNYIEMVATLLERYATPAGLEGIPTDEFVRLLGEQPAYLEID
jgi:hypothetical protein